MRVDVVIPVLNGSRFIEETLQSVHRQTLSPEKIIVVDDGCTDATPAIVARHPRVQYVKNPCKGAAAARNFGAGLATAPYVAFLDQDDLWHPEHLELLAGILDEHPRLPLAASGLKSFIDGTVPQFDATSIALEQFDPWEIYPTHDMACTPSITMLRREALVSSGGFPVDHDALTDYSLWMRTGITAPLLRTRAKTVAYRLHANSVTAQYRKNPAGCLALSLKTDDDLLRLFLGSPRTDREKLQARRRNQVAHALANVLRSLLYGGPAVFASAAARLEDFLLPEDRAYRTSLFNYLFFLYRHFCPGLETADHLRHFALLLEEWPEQAALSRSILLERIIALRPGAQFYLSYYARKPWQFQRLLPMAGAVQNKMQLVRAAMFG